VKILVAGSQHPWVKKALAEWVVPGAEVYTDTLVNMTGADYILFPHFSDRIPREIHENYECIGWHMTALPDARGGTPLQNLILAGQTETVITAFRITEGMDAGPIYLQRPLQLYGSAEEVYLRMSRQALAMANDIIANQLVPHAQRAITPTDRLFRRRTPAQSAIPRNVSLAQAYDHIRMLDAHGYPASFIDWDQLQVVFTQATRYTDRVEAHVVIKEKPSA